MKQSKKIKIKLNGVLVPTFKELSNILNISVGTLRAKFTRNGGFYSEELKGGGYLVMKYYNIDDIDKLKCNKTL